MTVYNFSAGPGVLAQPVKEQIQSELMSFQGSGMSVLEISHRSSLYMEMAAEAEADLRDLMEISDEYAVLFLPGGATLQFTNIPLNLARTTGHVAYLNQGHWAQKAVDAANKIQGLQVDEIKQFDQTPTGLDYLHITTNNTIEGTTIHSLPDVKAPIVADMSSNILAEPYQINDFDAVYAGAQKNMGVAGMAVVIVKRARLENCSELSDVMNYWLEDQKHSEPNTPPVFCIYAAGKVFKWLKSLGGVDTIYQQNKEQAAMLYDEIDNSGLFKNDIPTDQRSLTNIVFTTNDDQLNSQFISAAAEAGLTNLKGHRLLGGMRASLYNAMPTAGVTKLIEVMQKFESDHKKG